MAQSEESTQPIHVQVENIGGISRTEVSFSPGVTILAGENATNRTSFLQAIMAALGSDNVSLKADAETGFVEFAIGEETYTRRLERTNGHVRFEGEPYLEDPLLADLFAFLLEDNPARRAVANPDRDLRSVIMEPIDTAALKAEIQQYEAKKRQLDEQLAELDSLEDDLPGLREDATQLDRQIDEKTDDLDAIREEIANAEADLQETKQVKETLEAKLNEVQQRRSEYDTVTERLETERESLAAVREERQTYEEQVEDLPDSVADERQEIDAELSELRSRKSALESEVSELQNLIQFNEDLLGGNVGLLADLRENDGTADVTAQLVEAETLSCWTCGSAVERTQIEGTVDRLRQMREEKLAAVNDLDAEIEERKDQKRTLDERKRERERVERKLDELERELEERSETIEDLQARRDDLEADVERLETEIDELELADDHGELLDLHQEANRLELEIERLERERGDVETDIEDLEARLEERDELEAQREDVAETLTELRTRIERIETEAIEEFNGRIADVLDILEYGNIERIWIERKAAGSTARSGVASDAAFELHVVRSDASGTAYEDTIANLSESEREVTGLIFALAGYLVHEVYDEVPFMLLDSLEALDSARIAKLVDYFKSEAENLVIALLEEDAAPLSDDFTRVTEI